MYKFYFGFNFIRKSTLFLPKSGKNESEKLAGEHTGHFHFILYTAVALLGDFSGHFLKKYRKEKENSNFKTRFASF